MSGLCDHVVLNCLPLFVVWIPKNWPGLYWSILSNITMRKLEKCWKVIEILILHFLC